ncbi:dethiobiotin synthase [bacterium]|nr:dethiobiotin synthase [bacterium]
MNFPEKLYVIGNDQGVGKTIVSTILTLGLNAHYLKPIQCGISPYTDTEWIHTITGFSKDHFFEEFYRFTDAHDPSAQHTSIDIEELLSKKVEGDFTNLIIEGTEGVLSPVYGDYFQVDYIADLNVPVLLVVKNSKGAINQALLSLKQLQSKGIEIFGVVINGTKDPILMETFKDYCKIPNIFELDHLEHITKQTLTDAFHSLFKLEQNLQKELVQ